MRMLVRSRKQGDAWKRTKRRPAAAERPDHPVTDDGCDPFRGGFKVLITGPQGFDRTLVFALDDDEAVIAERVRETLDD